MQPQLRGQRILRGGRTHLKCTSVLRVLPHSSRRAAAPGGAAAVAAALPSSTASPLGHSSRAASRASVVRHAANDDSQNERIKSTLADLDALLGIQEEPKTSDKVSRDGALYCWRFQKATGRHRPTAAQNAADRAARCARRRHSAPHAGAQRSLRKQVSGADGRTVPPSRPRIPLIRAPTTHPKPAPAPKTHPRAIANNRRPPPTRPPPPPARSRPRRCSRRSRRRCRSW
jgi:hypothetical protein